MTLTNAQLKSMKDVTEFFISDEEKHFLDWMMDIGWGEDEVQTFRKLSMNEKINFMREHNELTRHVYFHLLILKSIG